MFAQAIDRAINTHGQSLVYKSVNIGNYSAASGSVTTTETSIILNGYPRQVVANQFNMPNLIGKEIVEFYFQGSDFGAIVPKVNDIVVLNGINYGVTQLRSYRTNGQIVMYKLLAIRQ